jgi:hypothetical protein
MAELKNQLHQLLAVENDRKQQANNIIDETIETFSKKHDHFDGIIKIYKSYNDADQKIPPETKEIVTSVKAKIDYSKQAIVKGIDAQISKEETNASGTVKAELKIDNVSFGELSATALLALEQHLVKIRSMYKVIPTLDPTKKWDIKDEWYETEKEIRYRTEKKVEKIIKYEATKEHPAQVELVQIDRQVGEYETIYKSGKISSFQKSKLLERIDKLIDAIKTARSKANECEVKNIKIGDMLFNYINSDII